MSVEATGAWDSDWRLADDLEAAGARVLRVWVSAPKQVAMDRLAGRTGRRLDARIDTGRPVEPAAAVALLRPLLDG